MKKHNHSKRRERRRRTAERRKVAVVSAKLAGMPDSWIEDLRGMEPYHLERAVKQFEIDGVVPWQYRRMEDIPITSTWVSTGTIDPASWPYTYIP